MKTRNVLLALCIANCAPSAELADDDNESQLAATVPGMIQVSASSFLMGCNTQVDTGCRADEYPGHTIKLSGYYIDQTEVTQSAYANCVKAGACTPTSGFDPVNLPNWPVSGSSWNQAQQYCAWAGKRLPTEAEWERAARGTDGRIYPWGNGAPDCTLANTSGCWPGTEAVGMLHGLSPVGAYDMAGNAFEWVADWYSPSYYSSSPSSNPTGPTTGTSKVARGGSYAQATWAARTSGRIAGLPSLAYSDYGFRCAKSQGGGGRSR